MELCFEMGPVGSGDMIPYGHPEDDSYQLDIASGKESTGNQKMVCAWDHRLVLAEYLITASTPEDANYVVGAQHPDVSRLFVSKVSIVPYNPTRRLALLSVDYKTMQFDPEDPEVLREEAITPAAEVITVPAETITYADDGSPITDQNIVLQYYRYSVTLFNVRNIDLDAINACVGRIHSGSMTLRLGEETVTIDGDRVMCEAPDNMKRRTTFNGVEDWTVTYNFYISPIGHNKSYNPRSTASTLYERFEEMKGSVKKFKTADFTTLGV